MDLLEIGDCTAMVDIKDAYQAVAIHPSNRTRQGLIWDFGAGSGGPTYMVDNRLCMGLSSSLYIFQKIPDLVIRCTRREGFHKVVNYLDYYCVVRNSKGEMTEAQLAIIHILRRLGFYVSYRKLTSLSTQARFLGIITDFIKLPENKVAKLINTLMIVDNRKKVTSKELEKQGGYSLIVPKS